MFQLLFSGARNIARVRLVLTQVLPRRLIKHDAGHRTVNATPLATDPRRYSQLGSCPYRLATHRSLVQATGQRVTAEHQAGEKELCSCVSAGRTATDGTGGSETGAPRSLTNSAKLLSLERVPIRIPTHSPFPLSPVRSGGSGVWL